jgi:hypothetical protein
VFFYTFHTELNHIVWGFIFRTFSHADRGAFWMARHGLHTFWGGAAWNPDLKFSAGPSWWIRIKYAWLATTRQLYRMLHKIGDEGLSRTYIVQVSVSKDVVSLLASLLVSLPKICDRANFVVSSSRRILSCRAAKRPVNWCVPSPLCG